VITSMTGYGRAEAVRDGLHVSAEVRSVNSRHFEAVCRLPRSLNHRENDVKELVRAEVARGKVSVTLTLKRESEGGVPLTVNTGAARSYYKLLNQLRKAVRLRQPVKLEHLLQFSDVLEVVNGEQTDEAEWNCVQDAVRGAVKDMNAMRSNEGAELAKDLRNRVQRMTETLGHVETISAARVPEEREKLRERIGQLLTDPAAIDQNRIELEVALLADKLDITEECVRYRSHIKFFLAAVDSPEPAGRKLNFLVQEMNREANTIGSKSADAEIAHLVVRLKEELEKVREQLQNVE